MTGRFLHYLAALILVASLHCAEAATDADKPNILVIITDDQGFGDLSCHGNTVLETPCIDRLAAESAEMESFYAAPVCAPTRAAFLTGRNPIETGVWGVHSGRDYLSLDETTIADVLTAHGYDTAMIGKWHSGRAPAWMPWNRGFQEAWVSNLYKHQNPDVSHNGHRVEMEGWATERFTDLAIDWIQQKREAPFFLTMAYMAPHGRWEAPDEYVQKYRKKGCSDRLSVLFGMIDHLDEHIGRLLDAVDESGLRENTLVILLSDNGPINKVQGGPPLSEESVALRNPQQLRGVKGNLWENGIRVPCFIRWPQVVKPRTISALSDVMDLFPTLLDAANIETTENALPLNGRSLLPLLVGRQDEWALPRAYLKPYWAAYWREDWRNDGTLEDVADVTYENQIVVMRDGPFKLLKNRHAQPQLYNIQEDPGETKDIANRYAEKTQNLAKHMEGDFDRMIATGRCFTQPRFHIGNPEYDRYDRVGGNLSGSQIPCCSSVRVTGNVVVKEHDSNGWTHAGDSQTILVDVVTPGRYEIELGGKQIYAGAVVRLSVGESQLSAEIKTSGRDATLGTINLQGGSQDLILYLESPPGKGSQAFDKLSLISFHKI